MELEGNYKEAARLLGQVLGLGIESEQAEIRVVFGARRQRARGYRRLPE